MVAFLSPSYWLAFEQLGRPSQKDTLWGASIEFLSDVFLRACVDTYTAIPESRRILDS